MGDPPVGTERAGLVGEGSGHRQECGFDGTSLTTSTPTVVPSQASAQEIGTDPLFVSSDNAPGILYCEEIVRSGSGSAIDQWHRVFAGIPHFLCSSVRVQIIPASQKENPE